MKTLSQIRDLLAAKKASSVELAQESLAAAKAHSALNAFLAFNEEETLAQARHADALLAEGKGTPITGVPLAHKDLFVTKGFPTTACSKMLDGYQSPFDATVVRLLKEAGTVCVGKVSCDEFAMGSGNQNSAYGPVHNPWDLDAVPGGSSGGSAAAVAAGIVPAATGTDTGGSVRQPASFCGISGIKPTYGTVSRFGMIAYASSLDQAGVFAHSAADLSLLLNSLCQFDPMDSTCVENCNGTPNAIGRVTANLNAELARFASSNTASSGKPLAGVRIGVPKEFFGEGLDPVVAAAVQEALRSYETLGATLVDISLPRTALSIPAYYVIAPAEASSNLSRYDGVRYGHRAAQYQGIEQMTSRSRAEGFGAEVQRRILVGTYVLSQGYYDAYYLQAQRVRRLIAQDFQAAFKEVDVIMGPVAPTLPPTIGENRQDPTADWLADIYTLSLNLAGLPGMSIPCGFGNGPHGKRLPIGLQLIGNYFEEGRLLAIADTFQRHTDWHTQHPEA